jgi:4-hydroxy-tetrahydrodipicolinate reductase
VKSPLRLAIVGASGRVGAALIRLAREEGLTIARAVGRGETGRDVGELAGVGSIGVGLEAEVSSLASGGFDVAIDFSSADALPDVAAIVAASGAALVSGTTGLPSEGERALEEASRRVAVLWEPNMSVGVHVLGTLLRDAIAALGDGFDIEIVETHHRKKVDAPSGTALRLADIAEESMGGDGVVRASGRKGRPGARASREIGLHAVRGGDVIGDHSVHLIGLGERLELVHRATNRDVFAHGALRAAKWIAGKPAGRYRLADILRAT